MSDAHPEPTDLIEPQDQPPTDEAPSDLLEDELLVEDVSIDGMCGVY